MMHRLALVFCLLLLPGLARADVPATQPTGITGTLVKPSAGYEPAYKIAATLGPSGVLFIRSQTRWDELCKFVPDMTPDTPLPKLDFTTHNIVLVYETSEHREANAFSLRKSDLAAQPPQLDFHLAWDNGLQRKVQTRYANFVLAVIPATPTVKVDLTSEPMFLDRIPVVTEFSATLGGSDQSAGDIVDGLQAAITPQAATIHAGEDIRINLELHLAQMPGAHPDKFGSLPQCVDVWDGKYSRGYANHAFFVTTPDGKTTLLRPKLITAWDKNAPHPVSITAQQPYLLPNRAGGDTGKSLQALGLDTSAPGTYTITGLYEESADTDTTPAGKKTFLWGGSIASNTVTVEVKK